MLWLVRQVGRLLHAHPHPMAKERRGSALKVSGCRLLRVEALRAHHVRLVDHLWGRMPVLSHVGRSLCERGSMLAMSLALVESISLVEL